MTIRSYRDLKVWQKGIQLTLDAYESTKQFPDHERYGLTSQLRRACVSIPSNIAEGHIQSSDAIFARHLEIALGSAAEVDTQLFLAHKIGYIPVDEYAQLSRLAGEIMKMLHAFIKTVRSRIKT